MAVQTDGKILAAGYSHFGGNWFTNFTLGRYHSDGSLDTSFGAGGKVGTDFDSGSDNGYAMAVQPDGKILVADECHHQAYLPTDFAVARYLTNGALDPGFGTGGTRSP